MKLSPLRKEVESLNKQLQSQNIQIKDLIGFLNKSTSKQNHNQLISPRNYLAKISHKKQKFSFLKHHQGIKEIQSSGKQNKPKQSLEKLKDSSKKHNEYEKMKINKEVPMTKSVKFHNIQNALTTRRYLKLSRPQKKLNSSCTFCRQSPRFIGSTEAKQSTNQKTISILQIDHNTKHNSSKKLKRQFKSLQNFEGQQKIKSDSKNIKKLVEKEIHKTEKKKTPLKQLDFNQIVSKNEIKKFVEKKSLPLSNSTKNKVKLSLKEEKTLIGKQKQKKQVKNL